MKSNMCLVIILMAVIGVSCKKDLSGDRVETLLSGRVTDGNSKQPIKDVKIVVWEYRLTDDMFKAQRYRYKAVDSALTDDKGNYSIRFQSSGFAISYKPESQLAKNYYTHYDTEELTIGKNNTRDLLAYQAKILKARIIYSENPYPPLIVRTWSTIKVLTRIGDSWDLGTFKLHSPQGDTTVLLKVIPQAQNNVAIGFYNGSKSYFKFESLSFTFSSDTLTKTFTIDPKYLINLNP